MLPRGCENYVQTDLAIETADARRSGEGLEFGSRKEGPFGVDTLRITDERGEKRSGRPRGSYVTVTLGRPWLLSDRDFAAAEELLSDEIKSVVRTVTPNAKRILAVGLGNREITADSLGPRVADQLMITRHVRLLDPELYRSLAHLEVSSLAPGVLGQTGIETLELVRGAVERVRPDLVVAVDSLASRSAERLAATVQISDSGLSPGSGIGNRRAAIDKTTLGVPVVAVGAPTVMSSSTLVLDALGLAGVDEPPPELTAVLENGRSFFVSLKECDAAVKELSRLIANALNRAFGA